MIQKLLKWSYDKLLPHHLRLTVDPFVSLRAPPVAMGFAERRVVFLAPHPDDDIAAFGGPVGCTSTGGPSVIGVHDPMVAGDSRSTSIGAKSSSRPSSRPDNSRRAEPAGLSASTRQFFLDNRDGELAPSAKTRDQLWSILAELRPEAVFLPFLWDNHSDHIATSRILFEATSIGP